MERQSRAPPETTVDLDEVCRAVRGIDKKLDIRRTVPTEAFQQAYRLVEERWTFDRFDQDPRTTTQRVRDAALTRQPEDGLSPVHQHPRVVGFSSDMFLNDHRAKVIDRIAVVGAVGEMATHSVRIRGLQHPDRSTTACQLNHPGRLQRCKRLFNILGTAQRAGLGCCQTQFCRACCHGVLVHRLNLRGESGHRKRHWHIPGLDPFRQGMDGVVVRGKHGIEALCQDVTHQISGMVIQIRNRISYRQDALYRARMAGRR